MKRRGGRGRGGGTCPELPHECVVDELLQQAADDGARGGVEAVDVEGVSLLQFEEYGLLAGTVRVYLHHACFMQSIAAAGVPPPPPTLPTPAGECRTASCLDLSSSSLLHACSCQRKEDRGFRAYFLIECVGFRVYIVLEHRLICTID